MIIDFEETGITGPGESPVANLKQFNEVRSVEKARLWLTSVDNGSNPSNRLTVSVVGLIGKSDQEVILTTFGPSPAGAFTLLYELPPQFVKIVWSVSGADPDYDITLEVDAMLGPV